MIMKETERAKEKKEKQKKKQKQIIKIIKLHASKNPNLSLIHI